MKEIVVGEARGNSLENAAEAMRIVEACRSFLRSMTPAADYQIVLDQRQGAFTRLLVAPITFETDPALCYMQLNQDQWAVLGVGTYFDDAFFEEHEIPKALHP